MVTLIEIDHIFLKLELSVGFEEFAEFNVCVGKTLESFTGKLELMEISLPDS